MVGLTLGAQIDELRRLLRESEQRRQAAEMKLADRERRLGNAARTIAEQRDLIDSLTTELASLRGAIAPDPHEDYVRDAARFFNVYASAVPGDATTRGAHPAKRSNLQVLAVRSGRCGLVPGNH
jgi:septal ring factor EnvC (AmiA/AmiB activator)